MLRFILLSLLLTFLLRALLRLWAGFVQGVQGTQDTARSPREGRPPQRSVHMARDPICGTFVVPERAHALTDGSEELYFCSVECRDKFRARTHSRPAAAHGRTA
jgi:YHS domain-containing protein